MEKILTGTTLPGRTASHVYRPDIDGLRTIAVLLVVLFHAWPNWLKSGFIGVDIFFVISGFLITSIIIENVAQNRFTISGFYARRVLRIFPALILVLAITLLTGWALLLHGELHQLGKHVASGAGFIANLTLWREVGYFDNDSATKPLLHLWSLGVEEQFYIVWPLMVWGIYRYQLGFLKISCVVFALSFGYSLYATFHSPTEGYFSPATRFWELMVGGISAHLMRHHAVRVAKHATTLTWCGTAMILVGAVFITEQAPFPGWWAMAPVLGTGALLLAGECAWINRNILRQPIVSRIGLVSYPLYLWHWPLLSFAFIVYGEKPPATMKVALVAAALVLAVLTYQLVELPCKRFKRRSTVIAVLCAGMAAVAVAGLLAAHGQIAPRVKSDSAERILSALNDVDFPTAAMTPYPYQGQTFQQVRGSGGGTTVFMGDSVMEQYGAYVSNWLRANATQRRAVIFATAGGCPPIRGAVRLPRVKFPGCQQTVDAAHALALSAEVDTVVIGAAWYGYFSEAYRSLEMGGETFPAVAAQERAYSALKNSLEGFVASGKRVFLVLSPPAGMEFDPRSMIEGSRLSGEVSARRDIAAFDGFGYRARNRKTIDRLNDIARENGATVIDPMLSLCPGMRCPVLDAIGEPVYTDSVHIRPGFSLEGAAYLEATLQAPGLATGTMALSKCTMGPRVREDDVCAGGASTRSPR